MSAKPIVPPAFQEHDFAAYEGHRQRDPEYNKFRLAVRRKLDTHGKALKSAIQKQHKLTLASRTSLNHPYKFNFGRVNAQWAYLSRSPKDKKALVERVGDVLAQDVDTHYIQTTIVAHLDAEGFDIALRVHALAWWDGINLANKCDTPAGCADFAEVLNQLPSGFVLQMDRWKREYHPGHLRGTDLENYFSYYQPGEHWLNLRRRIPKALAIELGPQIADFVQESGLALVPVYRFIVWTPENDELFDEDGRVRR
jgi:hypothetical protein